VDITIGILEVSIVGKKFSSSPTLFAGAKQSEKRENSKEA